MLNEKIIRHGNKWLVFHGDRLERTMPVISGGDGSEPDFRAGIDDGSTLVVDDPPAADPPAGTEPISTDQVNPGTGRLYTAAEVAEIRREEKDKLYGEVTSLRGEVREVTERERKRIAADEEARTKAEEEAKRKEEEALDVRELLARREQEWDARFHEMEERNAMAEAVAQREREYAEFLVWRSDRLSSSDLDEIIPQLRPMIGGNTAEEVEASIARLKETSSSIFGDVQAAQQAARQGARGVSATAPATGPMEMQQGQKTVTADDIKNMSMADWQNNREAIMRASSSRVKERGLYG